MSYTFNELSGQRGSTDRERTNNYVRRFEVVTTTLLTAPQVLALPEVPLPFEVHPTDPRALADKPQASQDDSDPFRWIVRVSYSSKIKKPKEDKNPLRRPAKVSIKTEQFDRPTLVDAKGKPILNTAGDLVEGLTKDDSRLTIVVEKNVGSVPNWIDKYNDAVNSDTIRLRGRTWKAGTLKFKNLSIPSTEITEDKIAYFTLSFELHHRKEGWEDLIPNRGFNEKVTEVVKVTDKTLVTFGDVIGKRTRLQKILVGKPPEPPSDPVWLDKEGHAFRNEDNSIRLPKPEEIIILKVMLYDKLPFSVLPLK